MSAKSGKGTGKDGGDEHDEDAVDTSIIKRLDRDLRVAAKTMSEEEARYLVDAYYTMQDNRKRSENQERQASANKEPCTVITWLAQNNRMLEEAIKVTLDIYTGNHPVGVWAKSTYGIGPVIAAGMLAHIDIRKAETVGHIWRYAGIDPTSSWLGKEKSAKLVKEFLDDRPPTESDVYAIAAQVQRNPTNLLKMATLDSVMTYQDVSRQLSVRHPEKLFITGEDRFLGYSLRCGARTALVGLGAICCDLQSDLIRANAEGNSARFLELSDLVDRLAESIFVQPMEGYIRRLLWALCHLGVIPFEASNDPWGPQLPTEEFDNLGRTLDALAVNRRPLASPAAAAPAFQPSARHADS